MNQGDAHNYIDTDDDNEADDADNDTVVDDDRASNTPDRFYVAFALLGLGFGYGMFNPAVVPFLIIIAGMVVMIWSVLA